MPLPDVAARITDPDDDGRELGAGEVGEICLSAPQLMTGFWHQPEETAAVLRDHPDAAGSRRWLHTGDLGYLDTDGYLFIVDRIKDLIKTSGFQVWPREVEEALSLHPAIAECGVAGVPDPVKGEAIKAWVVLRQGQPATEAEIRAFCREHLAAYKVPSTVEFRAELPKTMVGKDVFAEERCGKADRLSLDLESMPRMTSPSKRRFSELRRLAAAYMRRERLGRRCRPPRSCTKPICAWPGRSRRGRIATTSSASRRDRCARFSSTAPARGAQKRWAGMERVTLTEMLAGRSSGQDEAHAACARRRARPARTTGSRAGTNHRAPLFRRAERRRGGRALGISPATLKRRWALARAWLFRELRF
jgi:hypothetical protein